MTSSVCRVAILTFDAISIDQALKLNVAMDEVDGFVDFGGTHGRRGLVASNVLVFMLKSATTKWKQVNLRN